MIFYLEICLVVGANNLLTTECKLLSQAVHHAVEEIITK